MADPMALERDLLLAMLRERHPLSVITTIGPTSFGSFGISCAGNNCGWAVHAIAPGWYFRGGRTPTYSGITFDRVLALVTDAPE